MSNNAGDTPRELHLIAGASETLPGGLRVELLGSGYLHAPDGTTVSTCQLRLHRGSESQQVTLAREHPGPLRYESVMGWRMAVVDVEAYQAPNRATVSVQSTRP